jgi:PDZ domain-containing protein
VTVKRVLALAAVMAAVVGVLVFVPSDHYLFLPDRARPVDPLVQVPGESEDDAGPGGIYMVDILVRKASLLERVYPGIEEGSTLVPEHAVNPAGVSDTQRRQQSLNQMSRSQEIAVTVALRELGYRVQVRREGAEVTTVAPGRPADGELEVGDVIVEANAQRVRSPEELTRAMSRIEPGQTATFVVLRDDDRVTVELETVASEDDPDTPEDEGGRAVVGIIVTQAATFEFPVDVTIDAGDIGGPSAGLAFALDVTDELGEDDLDRGRRIAATGEIALDGTVSAIGGVKQKTIAARRVGAAMFLVPDANAAEARRYADGLKIVPVSDFDEAVDALTRP